LGSAFDGRARQRRIVIGFAILLLVVFGALLAAMAYSWTPAAQNAGR
jgi:hypothetical protein